jgi:hypothetical protein
MIPESEVKERALYCYLAYFQLSCLADNDSIVSDQYLPLLQQSSLQLAEDDFIRLTFEEEMAFGRPANALSYLLLSMKALPMPFATSCKQVQTCCATRFRLRICRPLPMKYSFRP